MTKILLILFLSLFAAVSVQAHNGQVAMAVPLSEIALDGDFSDWPADMVHYDIARAEWAQVPDGPEDLSGTFRVGYRASENALYLAVEVQDEDSELFCGVFFDPKHINQNRPRVQGLWSDIMLGPDTPGKAERLQKGRVVSVRHEHITYFEWRLDLNAYEDVQVAPNRVMALDVFVSDEDVADHSESWLAWGRGARKHAYANRRGDVVIVESIDQTHQIGGRIEWADTQAGIKRGMVRIKEVNNPYFDLQIEADAHGMFACRLPIGHYVVGPAWFDGDKTAVDVEQVAVSNLTLSVAPPMGRSFLAGEGSTIPAGTGMRQGVWQTYGAPDGLPASGIYAICQDKQGNLWMGTTNGLCRFDGKYFTTWSTEDGLPSNWVNAVVADRLGNVWVGTNEGVLRIDGKTFTHFTTQDGLSGNNILTIIEDQKGRLWFGTQDNEMSCYENNRFVRFGQEEGIYGDRVQKLYEDGKGQIWAGTGRRGVSFFSNSNTHTFSMPDGLLHDRVFAICEDRRGRIFIGTGNGVNLYVPSQGEQVVSFATQRELGFSTVQTILEDRTGHLWFGTGLTTTESTGGNGVTRYDGEKFVTYTTDDGLAGNEVWTIFEDAEGYLWFGTSGGLTQYLGTRFFNLTTRDGLLNNDVRDLLEDQKGNIWFATADGVSKYDGTRLQHITVDDGLLSNDVRDLLEDQNGNIWFATAKGVNKFDGHTFTSLTSQDGLIYPSVLSLYEDQRGHLWFCLGEWFGDGAPFSWQGNGVMRYVPQASADTQKLTAFVANTGLATSIPEGHLSTNTVMKMVEHNGYLWGGTREGLVRFDPLAEPAKAWKTYTTQDGLSGNVIRDMIATSQGDFLVSTSQGVGRLEGDSFVPLNDTLSDTDVWTFMEDQKGSLWLGIRSGVVRFDGQIFQNIIRRDGLVGRNVRAFLEDQKGDVWIATGGGVTRYHPFDGDFFVRLANVVADRVYVPQDTLELPASQQYIKFEFSGNRFTNRSDAIVFRYRLEGVDTDLHQTRLGMVEYHNLESGDYTFVVDAIDRDLNYAQAVKLHLTILLPWYRDPMWVSLAVFVFAGSWILPWRYVRQRRESARLRQQIIAQEHRALIQLEAQNEALGMAKKEAEISREEAEYANRAKSVFLANMSHEIRTPLNAILGYAQILGGDKTLASQHRKSIETIGQSGEHLLGLINDVLDISKIEAGREQLNVTDFDLNNMLDRLGRMFEMRCRQKNLSWKLQTYIPMGAVCGDEGKLRQVLINLLGNAVKFTKVGGVMLKVTDLNAQNNEAENHRFLFEIIDTGPGIDPEKLATIFEPFQQEKSGVLHGGTGLGLAISMRHVALMGETLQVESPVGEGAFVPQEGYGLGARFYFTLTLPVGEEAIANTEDVDWLRVEHLSEGETVYALVADDVPNNRDILVQMLTKIGVHVETAENGEQVLEKVREKMPDIVFMDIRMPIIDGSEALSRMFEVHGRGATKVIAATASVFEHQRDEYLDQGFDGFINKPVRIEEVYAALATYLGVTFRYEAVEAFAQSEEQIVWENIVLPEALHVQLNDAAEEHSITKLRKAIQAIDELGAAFQPLVKHLQNLAQQFDMAGIQAVLRQIDKRDR